MSTPIFGGGELREYHDGMLLVKARPAIQRVAATFAGGGDPVESLIGSPGISALEAIERAGMVRQVIQLAKPGREVPRAPGMRRMTMALTEVHEGVSSADPNAGAVIVELERDTDVGSLQVALARDPNVEAVSRVPVRYLVAAATRKRKPKAGDATIARSAPPASSMWNLRRILWQEARAEPDFKEARDIKVAVLDTGIDPDHPDLVGRVMGYTYDHPGLPRASSNKDIIGHGTHVAGTIMAGINNNIGINGICECELHAWKIFDDVSDYSAFRREFVYYTNPVMYFRALADCIEQNVDVINLSIGGTGKPSSHEQDLFGRLLANGTTIVAAMGNGRRQGSPAEYPGAMPGVIAVGATNINDNVANFSTRGSHISVCAPGVGIWSTLPTYPGQFGFDAIIGPDGRPVEGKPQRRETDYDAWAGTSMTTPHVAAGAALLLANAGKMTGAAVKSKLEEVADKVAGMGGDDHHPDYGFGRLNLLRLL